MMTGTKLYEAGQINRLLPGRGTTGPRYYGNTYQLDPNSYFRAASGAIIRREEKPMSRRDRIRAKLQPKNRFTTTKETAHA